MRLGPGVQRFLEINNLTGRIGEYVERSARCTLPEGNRRFHYWVFDIQGDLLARVTDLTTGHSSTPRALGSDEFMAYEECPDCGGEGCKQCGNLGDIRVVRKLKRCQR